MSNSIRIEKYLNVNLISFECFHFAFTNRLPYSISFLSGMSPHGNESMNMNSLFTNYVYRKSDVYEKCEKLLTVESISSTHVAFFPSYFLFQRILSVNQLCD